MIKSIALAVFASFFAGSIHAEILLRSPVDCVLGKDCYLQNFVDHDPSEGWSDFSCGTLSYDGHKGTDFALPTRADLARNVSVIAAASGTILGVRDGMEDIAQGDDGAPDVTGRDCGNGVAISHDGGWETQYCHMAKGSVVVRPGQAVKTGEVLGRIGLSGRTQFPHLHLSVRKDGRVIDPFDPDGEIVCGAPSEATLWASPLHWQPGGMLDAGLASQVPEYSLVKAGAADEILTVQSPALVVFGLVYGSQPGDLMTLTITGPAGEIFDDDVILDRAQALTFRAGGRRAPPEGWPAGRYTGTIVLKRREVELGRSVVTAVLE